MRTPSTSPIFRRRMLFAGAGTAGALAAAVAVLPRARETVAPRSNDAKHSPAQGGYQLTQHVQRYYQTAKV